MDRMLFEAQLDDTRRIMDKLVKMHADIMRIISLMYIEPPDYNAKSSVDSSSTGDKHAK